MFSDCGAVLRSKYSLIFGVPLALLGLIHYFILAGVLALAITFNKKFWWFWVLIEATAGAFASVYFMYLQIGIIGKLCLYCTLFCTHKLYYLFHLLYYGWNWSGKHYLYIFRDSYIKHFLKPFFFFLTRICSRDDGRDGGAHGEVFFEKESRCGLLKITSNKLEQNISGIHFANPVGLSAGI